ncbi:HD domain-containing protein [Rubrivirga sp. IMCC43871]|uniref:HD domain-containing protein n=1 Tax=Rubrivirga sp. IMCC43871 TaxID=3391575 RepID=UPI00398FB44E
MTELFSPLVERAIETAAEWHDATYRKGRWSDPCVDAPPDAPSRIPAMAHVTAVALTVQRAGWGDEAVAAAFLHDAIEDDNRYGATLAREVLAARVGEAVVAIVEAVSEPQTEGGAMLPWAVRKQAYLDRLAGGPDAAVAVSLADKLHNAYSMASSLEAGIDIFTTTPTRRGLSAGPEQQLWFFEAVLAQSDGRDDPRLAPMRDRLRVEIDRFAQAAGLGTG